MQRARIALSLCATLIGWASGLLYYAAVGYLTDGLGWRSDFTAIAFWTGWFILLGWFIVFLPILRTIDTESSFYSLTRSPVLGAFLGLVAFVLLVAWQAPIWQHWFYVVYPAVVGGATGISFAWFQRVLVRRYRAS